jgi:hypothetical protein
MIDDKWLREQRVRWEHWNVLCTGRHFIPIAPSDVIMMLDEIERLREAHANLLEEYEFLQASTRWLEDRD